ncbi:hypothetical protein GCM10022245_46700 [Streptomyces mayteni]
MLRRPPRRRLMRHEVTKSLNFARSQRSLMQQHMHPQQGSISRPLGRVRQTRRVRRTGRNQQWSNRRGNLARLPMDIAPRQHSGKQ